MDVTDWLGVDNTLGIEIWNKKYRHGDESFDQWLQRVSGGDERIKKLILKKKFLFGGRILSNRGIGDNSTTSNCFVDTTEDSLAGIYDTAKRMALTFKAGGGVGVDISCLAPAGAKVNNPAKTSSGAVSFIELFTTTASAIGSNGRRSALMISMACDHPDIEEFIKLKTDVNKATSANLSIRVSNDFMKAVKNDEDWFCSFTRKETGECISKVLKAKDLFKLFCDANYDYGEPGLLYWDRIRNYNMLDTYFPEFQYAGVNPCSEACLPDGGACLLGSMNLAEYITPNGKFDFISFGNDVSIAIRALNRVQDEGIPYLPLPKQKESAEKWRQIGLGIMGLGDMLIKMNIEYGSEESLSLCNDIGGIMAISAIAESERIGRVEGSFPAYDTDKTNKSSFIKAHSTKVNAMRNAQLLAIAPCGSIATMIGVTGGIEPLFALEYTRTTKSLNNKEDVFTVIPEVVKTARAEDKLNGLVCAQDIDYHKRIAMQAVWQKHIDSSISSTINLPEDFPKENIYDVYMGAWEMGLKGITVFRDGCKRAGILNVKKDAPKAVIKDESTADSIGLKRTLMTGCGTLHCLAFFDKETGDLLSLYDAKGSTGGCQNFMVGLSRMVSLSARAGCQLEDIVDQLRSCGSCPSYAVRRATKGDTSTGSCCPVAIGNALIEMHDEVMKNLGKYPDEKHESKKKEVRNPCPQCGDELQFSNGCRICPSCGQTACD